MNEILCYSSSKLDKASPPACKIFEKNALYLYTIYFAQLDLKIPSLTYSSAKWPELFRKNVPFFFLSVLKHLSKHFGFQPSSFYLQPCQRAGHWLPQARSAIAVVLRHCVCLLASAKCCANVTVQLLDTGKGRLDLLGATP